MGVKEEDILRILTSGIPQNTLLGEESARELLGKFRYVGSKLDYAKMYISKLFDMVPDEDDVLHGKSIFRHGRQEFHRNFIRAGQNIRKHTLPLGPYHISEFLVTSGVVQDTDLGDVLSTLGPTVKHHPTDYASFAVDILYLVVECKHSTFTSNVIKLTGSLLFVIV